MAKIVNLAGYPPKDGVVPSITSIDTHVSDKPKPHAGGGGA
jgi:hypothetical protein